MTISTFLIFIIETEYSKVSTHVNVNVHLKQMIISMRHFLKVGFYLKDDRKLEDGDNKIWKIQIAYS